MKLNIKIKTNIPYEGFSHAESVTIRGFRYGGRDTVDLQICWHVYAGQFYNRIASSSGGWAPLITLGVEDGKVVIHFDSLGYWFKIYVADYYSVYGSPDYAKNWSYDHTAISGDTGTDGNGNAFPVNTVPYKNDWGGLEYNADHGVGTDPDRHLKIVNGNLQIAATSGHGIDFGATSDGAGQTSELLDDYEEGTWSPELTNVGTITYTHQVGRYTKVGRQVHFMAYIRWSSRTNNGSYNIKFTGLPFTSADTGYLNSPIYVGGNEGLSGNNSSYTHIGGNVYSNNNMGQFRISNTTGSSEISLTGAAGSTSAGYIYWGGTYYV